jgi:hypothetical protein
MNTFRTSLFALAVFASATATPAQASKFLGISIGCDKGIEFSYCQGSDLKPSVKRAIDSAVVSYVRHANTDAFHKGRCEDAAITPQTTLAECYAAESGDPSMQFEIFLRKAVFADKTVHCMPNTQLLVGQAVSLNTIPRFDPYTGRERALTVAEYSQLLKQAGQIDCTRRSYK